MTVLHCELTKNSKWEYRVISINGKKISKIRNIFVQFMRQEDSPKIILGYAPAINVKDKTNFDEITPYPYRYKSGTKLGYEIKDQGRKLIIFSNVEKVSYSVDFALTDIHTADLDKYERLSWFNPMTSNKIKLEIGKMYQTENGADVKILAFEPKGQFSKEDMYLGLVKRNDDTPSSIRYNENGEVLSHCGNRAYTIITEIVKIKVVQYFWKDPESGNIEISTSKDNDFMVKPLKDLLQRNPNFKYVRKEFEIVI